MKFIIKNDARKVLNDFEINRHEVFTIDDDDKERKNHYIEYYVWYNMLISFVKNKLNKKLYIKFEGDIPVSLIEYIENKYPENEIQALFPRDKEDIKNCYNILIDNTEDLYMFLKESRNFWISIENLEEEMLQIKKLIPETHPIE